MIKYFIAYHATDMKRGSVIGNVDIYIEHPISNITDIRAIEQGIIEKHNFVNVVITNYIRL